MSSTVCFGLPNSHFPLKLFRLKFCVIFPTRLYPAYLITLVRIAQNLTSFSKQMSKLSKQPQSYDTVNLY